MFDFWKFYSGLLNRNNFFDDYWEQFPSDEDFLFKTETLSLLKGDFASQNKRGLHNTLSVIYVDGADNDYTDILLNLLDEKWHDSEEDIVSILELIKDPKSINKLFELALDIPDYDEMRGLSKKCIYALSAINTPEAIQKLEILAKHDDDIIKENANYEIKRLAKKD